jgi:hypothetical protein
MKLIDDLYKQTNYTQQFIFILQLIEAILDRELQQLQHQIIL